MSRLLLAILLTTVLLVTGCASVSTVDLQTDAQSGVYVVQGAVIHPGQFQLAPGESITVAQAIRRSGGFKPANSWDDGGDPNRVRVKRLLNGSMIEYTLRAGPGDRDELFVIRPGDYIDVPKRYFSSPVPNPLPFAS
jgi:protein involved in polysaccharide export with SLBB domain